jgi:hypothetical protein
MGLLQLILMQKMEFHPVVARVAIIKDHTHKKQILRPDAPVATVG